MYSRKKYPVQGNVKDRASVRAEELRKQEQLILEKKRLIEEQLQSQKNVASCELSLPVVAKVDTCKVKKPLFHRLKSQLSMEKKLQQVEQPVKCSQELAVSSFTTVSRGEKEDDKSVTETTQVVVKRNNETVYTSESNESPPVTTSRCKEAECCAIYVAINGDEEEGNLVSRVASDEKYSWLMDKDSIDYRYFRHRVQQLRSANEEQRINHASVSESANVKSQDTASEGKEEKEEDYEAQMTQRDARGEAKDGEKDAAGGGGGGKRKLKSRWGDPTDTIRLDGDLIEYAKRIYGSVELDECQWRQLEDQRKMRLLTNIMKARKESALSLHKRRRVEKKDQNKYEYDSDEDTEGGTWEHKRRQEEMNSTSCKAQQLTQMNQGKHHIGDFLPPDELEKFMKAWEQVKDGKASQLIESAYEKFKLTSNNIGYKMLMQMGWKEGQGLGSHPQCSRTEPIACSSNAGDKSGLGVNKSTQLAAGDDEYEAYRKRMMIAYRFRPNPLNNPRREYY